MQNVDLSSIITIALVFIIQEICATEENKVRCLDVTGSIPQFCSTWSEWCPTTCQNNPKLKCGSKVPMTPTLKLKPNNDLTGDSLENSTQAVIVESSKLSKRIIGGKTSQKGEWPWQVVLRGDINSTHMTSCGGSIIAGDIILSATHCVFPVENPKKWNVHVGLHNQKKYESFEEKIKVKKIVKHENFRSPGQMSDIALFQLERRIDFKQFNKEPICLPDPQNPVAANGQTCYISGWGRTSETGEKASVIKHASVKTVSREVCNEPQNYDGSVDETEFCAGLAHGGKDTCEGDSGGTLACRLNLWYATGIVSLGEGCGRSHKYGVYTNVTIFQDWIVNAIFRKLL